MSYTFSSVGGLAGAVGSTWSETLKNIFDQIFVQGICEEDTEDGTKTAKFDRYLRLTLRRMLHYGENFGLEVCWQLGTSKIAGVGIITAWSSTLGEIDQICVASEFRGEGLGNPFLKHLESLLQAKGCTILFLQPATHDSTCDVKPEQKKAQPKALSRWYCRQGYKFFAELGVLERKRVLTATKELDIMARNRLSILQSPIWQSTSLIGQPRTGTGSSVAETESPFTKCLPERFMKTSATTAELVPLGTIPTGPIVVYDPYVEELCMTAYRLFNVYRITNNGFMFKLLPARA